MRRGSTIALLVFGGSVFTLFSAAAAFLIGHSVGVAETRVAAVAETAEAREKDKRPSMNITRTEFENWSLVCRQGSENERRCILFNTAVDSNSAQVPLTISVTRAPSGVPVLIVDMPPGLSTNQGVTLTAGAAPAIKLPVQSCGPQRCRAVVELSSYVRAALETAEVTWVGYATANDQPLSYGLAMRGFRDGVAAWSAGTESGAPTSPGAD